MRTSTRPTPPPLRLLALSLVAATALAGCAADSGAVASPGDDSAVAGMCAPDEPDCDDTATLPGDGAAGACLAGATECDDIPGSSAPPLDDLEPATVEPRDGLVDVAPTAWEAVEANDDQTVLTVLWWGGDEACAGLDHVAVDESDEAVTITLHTGRVADVEACTTQAVLKAVEVPLRQPLGPRSILDGAG